MRRSVSTNTSTSWRVPPTVPGGADQLMALARQRDLEGIVVKRLDSPYRPGARSTDWRKVKIRLRQEFVVGGWLTGQGSLEDGIGSLVLGVWEGSELVVAGLAGSGLTDRVRAEFADRFVERDQRSARIERDPRPDAELFNLLHHAMQVGTGLNMDGDNVGTCLGKLGHISLRRLDHEVHIERK